MYPYVSYRICDRTYENSGTVPGTTNSSTNALWYVQVGTGGDFYERVSMSSRAVRKLAQDAEWFVVLLLQTVSVYLVQGLFYRQVILT